MPGSAPDSPVRQLARKVPKAGQNSLPSRRITRVHPKSRRDSMRLNEK
ncbi:hypothetical protein KIPB_014454, partial [Kipferlia bialata]|eukprot:g14454.t1